MLPCLNVSMPSMELTLHNSRTCCFVSQLPTDHLSISVIPKAITHCSPDCIVADLHTSTSAVPSSKSYGSIGTGRASHTSIFYVSAMVYPKWVGVAVNKSRFISTTLDIGQPDLAHAIGEAVSQGSSTCRYKTMCKCGHKEWRCS